MKRTTIERRVKNSVTAFFATEEENLNGSQLSFADECSLLSPGPATGFNEKGDTFLKILKQIFLFLPGAFFLYYGSTFFLYACFITKLNMFGFGSGLVGLAVSSFMTVFGIGSIKNFKHLTIPASICAVSFLVFILSLLLSSEATQVKFLFEYSVYLFPLVLITAYSVKKLADITNVEKNCAHHVDERLP
jgi:hypothetical protein